MIGGCERSPPRAERVDPTPSPNASILPAPLVSSPADLPLGPGGPLTPGGSNRGAPFAVLPDDAEPFRIDQEPPADVLTGRELAGALMLAEWRLLDLPPFPKPPEYNAAGNETLRKSSALKWTIELAAQGRMRIVISSRTFPLPPQSELRARVDRLGHLLIWPGATSYRVLLPGAARTLLSEGRTDAIPLARVVPTSGEAGHRLGYTTRRLELTTRTAKLSLDLAKLPSASDTGVLLCRLLAELASVDPAHLPCPVDEVPLRAQYAWSNGGSIVFEATAVTERSDLVASQLATPPAGANWMTSGTPVVGSATLFRRDELSALRLRGIEPAGGKGPEAMTLSNASDQLRYLYLDGLPIAWLMPGERAEVVGLPRGRYAAQWRTLLGDSYEPLATTELPAPLSTGPAPDAGR